MKRFLLAAIICAASSSSAFAGLCRVISASAGSVTIEFAIPDPAVVPIEADGNERLSRILVEGYHSLDIEGSPILPARRFFIGVTASDKVALDVIEEESFFLGGVLPSVALEKGSLADARAALAKAPPLSEQRFVRLSGIEKVRGRHCAFVDVYPVLFDPAAKGLSCARRIVVRLSFPPAETLGRGSGGGYLIDDLFVNAEQVASWRSHPRVAAGAQRTPFEFALSNNWIKIGVRERAVYAITYNDLLSAGANPASIDAATLRLYSGGPFPQPDSLRLGGSYRDDYHLTEHAILFRGQGGGSLQPTDTILFYGIPASGWANDADPSAGPRQYMKHPYDSTNYYWLTWEGDFTGPPRRIDARDVTPLYAPGDTLITWYEERMRGESDLYYDPIYADDRWYWNLLKMNGGTTFQNEFYARDIADASGVLKTRAYGPYNSARYQNTATYRINGALVGTISWIVTYGYNPSNMKTVEFPVSNIGEGRNVYTVTKALDNEMYIFWYEIYYHRLLKASSGALYFGVPERARRARYELSGFAAEEKLLLDVTFDESPVLCAGWQPTPGGMIFEDSLQERPRRYAAVSRSAFKKASLAVTNVPSLRDIGDCPDMVILYHEDFRDAALALKAHREGVFPGVQSPVVRATSIGHVYDNFSGGHKDPVAIRNYLKFLYDWSGCGGGGEPALKYVLLIGNGTYDTRRLSVPPQDNDFVPLYINVRYPNESEAVEDEDFFVKLDDGIDQAPDLGIGRLSVLTSHEANAWAQRIIDYEAAPERGTWRNSVILVADDENSTYRQDDYEFLISTEELTERAGPFPTAIDISKIYLHVYPPEGDLKPAARKDLLRKWSDGALIVNYNGHGSSLQMADERVMVISDIYALANGMRLPLFLSFSCSVGDLDSPLYRSMAQNLVTYDAGGAIATIAAAAPTYLHPNKLLNETIYEGIFTSKDSTGTRPLGYALQLAKYAIVSRDGYESNNSKYLLLGDPAMRLAAPSYRVEHETAEIDTMRTGHRYRVTGSVTSGGGVLASFNGTAEVSVQEAEYEIVESLNTGGYPVTLRYSLPGKELYRGTVDVTAGRFSVEYVVPRRCHAGPNARIRSYVASPSVDGVGACDTLVIIQAETQQPNLEPPSVNAYFSGQATKVKAGARLIAEISDPDGIAILGTQPQNSIFLEFDGSGFPIYVTDYFTYDHESSTSGRVEYPLSSDFESGPHTVMIKAFDNLGLSSSDTLRFEIVEKGRYEVSDVFNLPNPFSTSTNFIFQVTNPAEARLSVMTVSGIKVWEKRIDALEGFNSIYWDGRDWIGEKVANGTYLYVLEIDFKDAFHRTETVRGKAVLLR